MGFCDGYKINATLNKNRKEVEIAPEYEVEIESNSEIDVGMYFEKMDYTIKKEDTKLVLTTLKTKLPKEWEGKGFTFDELGNGYKLKAVRPDGKTVTFKLEIDEVKVEKEKPKNNDDLFDGSDDLPF